MSGSGPHGTKAGDAYPLAGSWERLDLVQLGWAELIAASAPWQSWLDFTYSDETLLKHRPYLLEPSPDELWGLYAWWVKAVNVYAGGRNYRNKWGHSYFSYAAVMERGERLGRLHIHCLIDNYFDYHFGREAWWAKVGHLDIEDLLKVSPEERQAKVPYLAKYCTKGVGDPRLWVQPRRRKVTGSGGSVSVLL